MRLREWPVLLVGGVLLVAGAWRLLDSGATSPAAAGALLGAGLLAVGAWIAAELNKRD